VEVCAVEQTSLNRTQIHDDRIFLVVSSESSDDIAYAVCKCVTPKYLAYRVLTEVVDHSVGEMGRIVASELKS
jgi:hypothetical protein